MGKRRPKGQQATKPSTSAVEENTSASPAASEIPHSTQSDQALEKERLEVEKLQLEVEGKRQASRWFVSAIRNMKLNEWAVGFATIIALCVAWTSGLFDATRQNLAAQSERLNVEKIELERKREKLTSEIKAKESELEVLRTRLLPFENEETAVAELRQLSAKNLAVRFSTTPAYDGLRISLMAIPENPWLGIPDLPRTNPLLSDVIKAVNRVRSLKGLRISELTLSPDDASLASEHSELEVLVIEYCGMESKVLTGLHPLPKLRSMILNSNEIRSFDGCNAFPVVEYLDVSANSLGDEGLTSLVASFPNVTYLNLSRTNVSDEGMKTLVKLQHLVYINLHGTRATGQGALALLDCPKLNTVNINKEVVTDEQRAVVPQRRPISGEVFLYLHEDFAHRWGGDW